ncbi:MAG: hypothetical protein ABIS50_05320 [Luteolibacter sp.]|uniref:hypothetical protein n=1 Tax=Luteolibacter sp. TaxID=1962973 RepID=UPI003263CCBE
MIRTITLTLGIAIFTIAFAAGDPKPTEKKEAEKPMSIEQILRRAETNKCYEAIVLPMVIDDRFGLSGKIEAGAPDYTVIPPDEIPKFFELLKKRKPCDGLELGFQYELTFLMEGAPTVPAMGLMFRKVGKVWFIANLEEKFEMKEEFSKWMNERMLKMNGAGLD